MGQRATIRNHIFDYNKRYLLLVVLASVLLLGTLAAQQVFAPSGSWDTTKAPFTDTRTGTGVEGAAVSHINGKIYVSHGFRGGDRVFLSAYDIAGDSWTHGGAGLPDAPGSVQSELVGASSGGKHYAIGGRAGSLDPDRKAVQEFDPVAGTWATKLPMPTARAAQYSGVEVAGKIYVIGGRTGGVPQSGGELTANEVYDVATNTWSTLAPIPIAVSDAAAEAFNNKIYVFGGFTAGPGARNLVQIYDIAGDSWSSGSTTGFTARSNLSAGICGSNIHLVGGVVTVAMGNLVTHEVYNTVTNTWIAEDPVPTAISEVQAVSVGNKIYFIGSGIFGASGSTNQIWDCEPRIIAASQTSVTTIDVTLSEEGQTEAITDAINWSLSAGSVSSITDVSITPASVLELTLSSPIATDAKPDVTYTNPGDIKDDAGNLMVTQTFTATTDEVPPTVGITSSSTTPTNDNPISMTATFSEEVADFVVGDIVVVNGAKSNFATILFSLLMLPHLLLMMI